MREPSMADVQAELSKIGDSANTRVRAVEARLLDIEQRGARSHPAGLGGFDLTGTGNTLGAQVEAAFNESDNHEMLRKGGRLTLDVQSAITTTESGGSHGGRDLPRTPAMSGTSLSGMLTPGSLDGLTVLHYARRVGTTGGAAVQDGEGATKATAEAVFSPITQAAITIAGIATCSEQALDATGGLRRAVDSHLAKSVRDAVDAVLIDGTVVAAWPFAGFEALAAAFTSAAGFTSIADAVLSGATRMRLQGFNPTIAVLGESEYLTTLLAKGSDGHYLANNYLRELSLALGGMGIALSASVTAGKALLLDESFCGFLSSGATRVSIGYVDSGFATNTATIRGETQIIPFVSDYQGAMIVTPHA